MSSSRGRWGRWSHLAGEIALRPRSEAWGALRSSVWGIVDVNENEGCDHRVGKHRHRPHDKGYATLQCPRDGCDRRDRSGIGWTEARTAAGRCGQTRRDGRAAKAEGTEERRGGKRG